MDSFQSGGVFRNVPELFSTMTLVAIKTKRIRIGAAVTDLYKRHPACLAQSIATVSQFSNGRAILELGAGDANDLSRYGVKIDNPLGRLREGITILRLLMQSDDQNMVDFEGTHYHLKKASIQISGKPRVPIYLGALGPKMLELAGELADGWLPYSLTPAAFSKAWTEHVKKALVKSGRSENLFDRCLAALFYFSDDSSEAAAKILQPGRRFLKHGKNNLRYLSNQFAASDPSGIPDSTALETTISGSLEECLSKLRDFEKSGYQWIILMPFFMPRRKILETIRLVGKNSSEISMS